MRIIIDSTSKLVELGAPNGGGRVPARVWEGHTDTGIPVHCFVTRIAPTIELPLPEDVDRQFKAELMEQRTPTAAVECYPLRMVL
jgi:hypothetical protein